MLRRAFIGAIAAIVGAPRALLAQRPRADTLVLRITSPRGVEIVVSGVIRIGSEERAVNAVRTPYEIRLPADAMEARFEAGDGDGIGGDLALYRDGRKTGHVYGIARKGSVNLYYELTGRFGFGRRASRSIFDRTGII